MTRRVEITAPVAADIEALVAAIRAEIPSVTHRDDGSYQWTRIDADTTAPIEITATLGPQTLTLAAAYELTVPYFGWVFAGPVRASVRGDLRYLARSLDCAALGTPAPESPKPPWWAPPGPMNSDQIRVVATISFILALVEYGGALLTQTIDYVATTYGATNAELGVLTAVTRVGTLIALVGGVLADRIGRRRVLLWTVALVSIATALTAIAPNLASFGALQLVVRGGVNLAFSVAFIAAVEEAPEASRTYTIAIVGIASGLGFVAGVCLLPLADVDPDAWRVLYGLGIVGLLFLPGLARRLTETKRFDALVARDAQRGRMSEVVDRRYGGRFLLLCLAAFLVNIFFAPQSQFMNRYLGDERDFSGLDILLLRAVTQAVPAFAAAYIGGRLAESSGRKPTAVRGLIVMAIAFAVFFSLGSPWLWLTLPIATAAEALAGPALSAFGTELFPTEVRGTAGAGLTLAAVLGSAAGLLFVGYLADPLGSVGYAVAVTAAAPFLVAIFLINRLPEAKGKLLDDVSPSEV